MTQILTIALSVMAAFFADSPTLDQRLSSLVPTDAESYFLLAEDVASAPPDLRDESLARTLYVLAFHLDRASDTGSTWIGPSACLGLAEIEPRVGAEEWLRALAGRLDQRYAQRFWAALPGGIDPDESLALAEVITLVREGEGPAARRRLAEPGVRRVLEQLSVWLADTNGQISPRRLVQSAEAWPCPECQNRRTVRGGLDGQRWCPTCDGNPGPSISQSQRLAQYRVEATLLSAGAGAWSTDALLYRGAALRDPEPSELSGMYRVDLDAFYWRNGGWSPQP